MRNPGLVLVAFAAAFSACKKSHADSADEASRTAVATQSVEASSSPSTAPSDSKSACPRTGLWARCSVEKRLGQSGFVVKAVTDSPRRPGFSVRPGVYALGSSHLEVFLYPTEQAAARDASGLDTVTAAPRGSKSIWPMAPTFVRSANMLAVFQTDSPVRAERLMLALTAGPPQP